MFDPSIEVYFVRSVSVVVFHPPQITIKKLQTVQNIHKILLIQ